MLGEVTIGTATQELWSFLASVWQVLGGLGVVALALWRLTKRAKTWVSGLSDAIVAKVELATYPIQPHANGGNSLPDATKMLRAIGEKQIEIGKDIARVQGSLQTHLDWHNGG
jgi:hypothetical protein